MDSRTILFCTLAHNGGVLDGHQSNSEHQGGNSEGVERAERGPKKASRGDKGYRKSDSCSNGPWDNQATSGKEIPKGSKIRDVRWEGNPVAEMVRQSTKGRPYSTSRARHLSRSFSKDPKPTKDKEGRWDEEERSRSSGCKTVRVDERGRQREGIDGSSGEWGGRSENWQRSYVWGDKGSGKCSGKRDFKRKFERKGNDECLGEGKGKGKNGENLGKEEGSEETNQVSIGHRGIGIGKEGKEGKGRAGPEKKPVWKH